MRTTSPTVANWDLVKRIRDRAALRGVTAKSLAAKLSFTPQYVSLVMNGKGVLAKDKLETLIRYLEFDKAERAEMLELREIAKEPRPYAKYSGLFNDTLMRFYGLEAGAQSIRTFENNVVPGLLQTEDYARDLISSTVTISLPTEVDQRVAVRTERGHLLTGPDPIDKLSVVMGQAALMQEVGGPDVHRGQLAHLHGLVEEHPDRLDLRIVPFKAGGAVASLNSATYHLLDFESGRLPTLGWVESAIWGEIVEDPEDVNKLAYKYKQVQAIALEREESLGLIEQIARQIG
ncbi:helix-turn-helix domain-containing protein [Nocardia iowensis]|uniref:Helix-turn-helix domain-containing protein n=1 Tax=Nocardia iowensis TaxID=204891 RepID=A0ABX8RYI9_NOCIO|nr:helix-turn-helix transcriptional regulator [Nocardia iowensis]QXN94735.1 helix-turn-helix domain-containing protein [Nocardia iowensis]